nr:hypothetical protein [Tanacetum cinerariifolium]
MANEEEDHALVADEVVSTEFALMANTSAESKVFDNSLCSKDCKKNNDSLNSKITDLTDKFFDANNYIYHYNLELAQVESRLVEYKEREVKYIKKIRTLEFYNESNKECIETLKKKLETLKQEREGVDGKLACLLTASKDIDNPIESQRSNKNKEGLGYTVVPPSPAQLYLSPKTDLSWTGLPECTDDTVTDYSRPSPTVESISEDDQNRNPSVSKNLASPITPKPFIKFVKPKDSQSKTDKKETPKKLRVKSAEQYRKPNKKPNVRGNQRNWNNLKSHQLGSDFVMKKKACFNCGDFNHLAYGCRKRVKKNFTPRPVAHKPYRPSQRPVRTNMNDARPNRTFFNKQAHSYANRPVNRTSAVRSPYRAPWVSTVNRKYPPVNRKFSNGSRNFPTTNRKFPTASRKFPTCSTKSSTADMERKGKTVKPSACWFWRPSQNLSNKGNISYLSDYEPSDGEYVSFGQGGCKITGKGTIKTGKLEFKNVYFVKDLKYNLFSVSQIYDNKNSVLFTDSECIVLRRDFKLLDDANILLRTLKQHNMYSIDLNNIVPHRDLTCLVAKASADECMLWHMRLGHLNFKTMNELVRHNLVRGLPTKCFENDHTCTGCLKGKQHKASCKSKLVNSVTKPIHTLHMDLFGPTSVSSISHKWYCLVVTDDFFRFTWTFFLKSKDETSGILKKFITEIENLKDLKVKIISKPQDHCSTEVPEGSRNPNPTASTSNPSADQMETLTVKTSIPIVSSPVPTAYSTDSQEPSSDARLISKRVANQEETRSLDNILSLTNRFEDILGGITNSDESNGEEADISNMETTITSSPTPTLRIHKDHSKSQIIGPMDTPIQTRNKSKEVGEQNFIATIHQKTDPVLLQFCLFLCFLSQVEPKKISDALQDPSWVEAMTKWVLKNKKDERGIVIRNKASLEAQGHTQEEGIDYDEVFAPVARIEAIRLFLAYASFMGFTVYQMDSKSAFFYGTIDGEVYVMQPPGFQDPEFPAKVYKVEKAIKQREDFILVQVCVDGIIFGSSNPQLCREFEALMHEKFQMSAMGELNFFLGRQVLQKEDVIFLSQDKYVRDILKKFGYSDVRSSNTPMDKENPWGKDGTEKDADLHLYRSMIGSLMYLTASRPDIMFAVCACARHQVTPKECYLHAVKRIFRYLKGHPKLGLWYPKESPFNLVAYSDSDYGGSTQDRKSTTGGCQFLGRRFARIPRAPERYDFHVNAEEHELKDYSESSNYIDTLSDLELD